MKRGKGNSDGIFTDADPSKTNVFGNDKLSEDAVPGDRGAEGDDDGPRRCDDRWRPCDDRP